LMGGFVDHLTVRRDCEQGEEKQNEEEHVSY
jgi:hypothetical protein